MSELTYKSLSNISYKASLEDEALAALKPEGLADLSDKALIRLAFKIDNRMRWGYGYQPFGFDWPTLWATRPGLASVRRDVWAEGKRRGL